MRFVEMQLHNGRFYAVNPDRVAYVRDTDTGVELIFEAVQGGLHTLAVKGSRADVLARLQGEPLEPLADPPPVKPPRAPRART